MSDFFKQLAAALDDRQDLRMNVKKIGEDLVVTVTPNFKEATKNIEMSGSPEEMDENFINEIKKPLEVKAAFSSNADEVKEELEEEEEEEEEAPKKETSSSKKKPANKKAAPKKIEKEKAEKPKKEVVEKTEPVKEEGPSKKELFDGYMAEGKKLHEERNYQGSVDAYIKAHEIFPDKANNALAAERKWVIAVANLPKPKDETVTT